MADFKDRLRVAMERKGITQRELSNLTGIPESSISEYRKGKNKAAQRNTYKIAKALDVNIVWLMGLSDDIDAHKTISIDNIAPMPEMRRVPRLGAVACGDPILAVEETEEYDDVPVWTKADYTLVCKGDSMIGARIFDGDIACIHRQPTVENGEIAAVLIDDEVTLKRFEKVGDTILLKPENPAYQTMVFTGNDAKNIQILGKATYFIIKVV